MKYVSIVHKAPAERRRSMSKTNAKGGEALLFLEISKRRARFAFEGTSAETRPLTQVECEVLCAERKRENLPYAEVEKALHAFTSSPSS